MFIACWSVKGGSGTTVVAAAHALHLARSSPEPVVVVDLAGEMAAVLGVPDPPGPGVLDWLASVGAGPDLLSLGSIVAPNLLLIPRGGDAGCGAADGDRRGGGGGSGSGGSGGGSGGGLLAAALAVPLTVVVDCGVPVPGSVAWELAAAADHSWLVVRPCYLALRRAVAAPLRPSAVVLVTEPERALTRHDVEDVLGVPVRAEVPWDAAIARAVDAGLLASRLPRGLQRAVRLDAAA